MIGEKSEVYYFDKDGNMVDRVEDSYRCIARELDENGKLVSEVFGYVNYKPEYKREDIPEITEEEKKELAELEWEYKSPKFK